MSNTDLEKQLINRVLLGERKAIREFTNTYGAFMYNVSFKILQNSFIAEEATQDSLMKVLKSLDKFDVHSSLKAWCYTITYRTAIDYSRKKKPTVELNPTLHTPLDTSADETVKKNELSTQVAQLMNVLDDESKMIITLFYLEERNIKEVMEVTGLTESNIKIKLFRARKKMLEYSNNQVLQK